MIVVADTSPVNYLVLIGEIDLLPKIYRSVLVPEAVRDELLAAESPELVRDWVSSPPDWFQVKSIAGSSREFYGVLDAGEGEAITLATEQRAAIVLIDELAGRRVALERGFRVVGTIGVLLAAKQKNLVDADLAADKLLQTNFRISRELLLLLRIK